MVRISDWNAVQVLTGFLFPLFFVCLFWLICLFLSPPPLPPPPTTATTNKLCEQKYYCQKSVHAHKLTASVLGKQFTMETENKTEVLAAFNIEQKHARMM